MDSDLYEIPEWILILERKIKENKKWSRRDLNPRHLACFEVFVNQLYAGS